jgi:hypothetical protein
VTTKDGRQFVTRQMGMLVGGTDVAVGAALSIFPDRVERHNGKDGQFKFGFSPTTPYMKGSIGTLKYSDDYSGKRAVLNHVMMRWKGENPGYNKVLICEAYSAQNMITFKDDCFEHCRLNGIPVKCSEAYNAALTQEFDNNVRGQVSLVLKMDAEGNATVIYVLGTHSFHIRYILKNYKEEDGMECEFDTTKILGYNAETRTTVIRGSHYTALNTILKETGMRITTKRAASQLTP